MNASSPTSSPPVANAPQVSVIVPVYNGAATIDETLDSIRAQTLSDIEIIVVDDGSTDETAARVKRHAIADPRIRLLHTANGGVARARNAGIAAARADLVAPVDADDLWHPQKLELQVAAMQRGGDKVGLVYCWFTIIDEHSRLIGRGNRSRDEGDVLRRMSCGNLVGNGSAPLMRKAAVLAVQGYDPGLHDQGAQGCEDLKIYFAIAERWHFAIVPHSLVGYRATQASMSSDARRMLRSYDLVMNPARQRHPALASEFRKGRIYLCEWLLRRAATSGSLEQFLELLQETWRQSRWAAVRAIPACARRGLRRLIPPMPRSHFRDLCAVRIPETAP